MIEMVQVVSLLTHFNGTVASCLSGFDWVLFTPYPRNYEVDWLLPYEI